ncbi:MAG: glycosyltransferase family 4 protein [Nanoarchaeota archaeon]|nr:glycosyltransferase family 4 protein [Nanoarchaeota archaeon]
MKIIIISYIYPNKLNPTLGIFVRQQSKYIAREGHEVHILTTGSSKDRKEELIDKTTVHRLVNIDNKLPLKGFLFSLKCIKMIVSLNKKSNIDFVIQNFVGMGTILIGITVKLLKKRFIVVSHGTSWELPKKNFIKNLIIKMVLSVPDKIVCVSKKTEELLSFNTQRNKLVVINNGIDPEWLKPDIEGGKFRKKLGLGNKIILLSVCSLVPKKGIDIIIKVLPRIIKEFPNLMYLVVGDGPEKEKLTNLTNNLCLEKNIKFLGTKMGSELANYYNICDIFILMSRDLKYTIESFGIVYIEASYFGKPVIAGVSGGTKDAVIDWQTGFLVKSDDTENIVKKLALLIKNKKLREKLGKAGRKRVIKSFFWKHNVRKLINMLNNLKN